MDFKKLHNQLLFMIRFENVLNQIKCFENVMDTGETVWTVTFWLNIGFFYVRMCFEIKIIDFDWDFSFILDIENLRQ